MVHSREIIKMLEPMGGSMSGRLATITSFVIP